MDGCRNWVRHNKATPHTVRIVADVMVDDALQQQRTRMCHFQHQGSPGVCHTYIDDKRPSDRHSVLLDFGMRRHTYAARMHTKPASKAAVT